MFTGIIEDIGSIIDVRKASGKWVFGIRTSIEPGGISQGDSVSVDGVCLTATKVQQGVFYADASLETLNATTLREKKAGTRVNLERALSAAGRFGGHIVMGHVDGLGTLTDIRKAGDSWRLEVEISPEISQYIVRKGSVAIDGLSLTVNEQRHNIFTVNIIPYTASKTTIGDKKLRDKVNIETDIIGRYIQSFLVREKKQGVDLEFLFEHGYIKGE
jgi:riboflavin synthase